MTPKHHHANLQASLDAHLAGRRVQPNAMRAPVHTFPVNEEHHLRRMRQQMRVAREELPRDVPQLHVGVAGFANLDLAAAERADALLLLDINADQRVMWEHVIDTLKTSETPQAFRENFYAKCYETNSPEGKLLMELQAEPKPIPIRTDGGAIALPAHDRLLLDDCLFLQSGMHYDHIRQLACAGKIAFAQADLTDKNRMLDVRRWIDTSGMQVASIYASNVQDCMKPEVEEWKLKKMQQRLKAEGKPHDVTTILNSERAVMRDALEDSLDVERVIRPKRGFYGAAPAPLHIGLLANAAHTKLYHCSTDRKAPLLVMEGKTDIPVVAKVR